MQMLIMCCKMNIKRTCLLLPCNYRVTDRREREGEESLAVTMTGQMSGEIIIQIFTSIIITAELWLRICLV